MLKPASVVLSAKSKSDFMDDQLSHLTIVKCYPIEQTESEDVDGIPLVELLKHI